MRRVKFSKCNDSKRPLVSRVAGLKLSRRPRRLAGRAPIARGHEHAAAGHTRVLRAHAHERRRRATTTTTTRTDDGDGWNGSSVSRPSRPKLSSSVSASRSCDLAFPSRFPPADAVSTSVSRRAYPFLPAEESSSIGRLGVASFSLSLFSCFFFFVFFPRRVANPSFRRVAPRRLARSRERAMPRRVTIRTQQPQILVSLSSLAASPSSARPRPRRENRAEIATSDARAIPPRL